ncbi:MAG: aldo/keto reductase [Chitinispirillales bacterium]|jgi:aryl-alcohol dehydrogenase-like predicted oxidoreductase|nr:aldo/keto reductase [Chitinispirillales bacterium]
MEKRKLGNSDLHITRVGLGAWAIGGAWRWGWGHQEDKDSIAAIRRAVELGVNWIDTAAVYGLGHSEEVVGAAIKDMPANDRPYVFTKCGLCWDDRDNESREAYSCLKAPSVRKEAENSLKRLGTDAIDLYQIHWPNPNGDIEEAWTEMAKLKEEGKVRWIGVSNHTVKQMERLTKIAPVTSLQPPYNFINRTIETDILPYCQKNGIGTIVYSPMASGLLTGKMTPERIASLPDDDWRKQDYNYTEPQLSRNLKIVDAMRSIAEKRGVPAAQVAIAWVLKNPAVTAAIVGMRRPSQAEETVGAAGFALSDDEVESLNQVQNA